MYILTDKEYEQIHDSLYKMNAILRDGGCEDLPAGLLHCAIDYAENVLIQLVKMGGSLLDKLDNAITLKYHCPHCGGRWELDPELEAKVQQYYRLLALRNPTDQDKEAISRLKTELDKHKQFGSTRRERLMLEAVDEQLAQEPDLDHAELKEETRKKVAEIWSKVLSETEDLSGNEKAVHQLATYARGEISLSKLAQLWDIAIDDARAIWDKVRNQFVKYGVIK